jgi:hypothetical protein
VLSVANIVLFPALVPTALSMPSVCFTKDVLLLYVFGVKLVPTSASFLPI